MTRPPSGGTAKAVATDPPVRDQASSAARATGDPWRDGHALGAELNLFFGSRLGSSGFSSADEERGGLGLDLGAWLALTREYAFGFGLTRSDLGRISSLSGANQITADYAATAVHLGARAFPWRGESSELFVGLRVGLAWQDLDATGLRVLEPNLSPPDVFSCSGVDGPALALGAGIGFAERIAGRAWFIGRVDANGYRLSGDVIDGCALGIGSVTTASVGIGFLYAFDLGEENRLSGAPRAGYTW